MAFTPVEIIALVIIILAVIKIAVFLVNPKSLMNFAKSLYAKPKAVSSVALILAAIIFYYIIQEMSIVQILAVSGFMALIILIGLAPHISSLIKKYETQIKRGHIWKENGLYILIWLILIVWGAWELFL